MDPATLAMIKPLGRQKAEEAVRYHAKMIERYGSAKSVTSSGFS